MQTAAQMAQEHWNETPLFISEEERYEKYYPWLPEVGEFYQHAGENVLEIGCGTACDLLQFAKGGAHATGVDITDEHLRLGRERVQGRAELIKADARNLPFPDNTFDYVYSHGVIHHSDEPGKIAGEVLRVLKPGGCFNVHVYAKYSWFPVVRMIRYGTAWRNHIENSAVPVHIALWTGKYFREVFSGAEDLKISKIHGIKGSRFLESLWGWYLVGKGRKPKQE